LGRKVKVIVKTEYRGIARERGSTRLILETQLGLVPVSIRKGRNEVGRGGQVVGLKQRGQSMDKKSKTVNPLGVRMGGAQGQTISRGG